MGSFDSYSNVGNRVNLPVRSKKKSRIEITSYPTIEKYRQRPLTVRFPKSVFRVMITEAYTSVKNTMRYYGDGARLGAHLTFNFGLIIYLNDHSNAAEFKNVVSAWLDNMPEGKWANWVVSAAGRVSSRSAEPPPPPGKRNFSVFQIGNHDQPRITTRFGDEMVDAMNMLNLLLPGTAFTYMGEEIGMQDTNVRWDQTIDPLGLNAGRDGFRTLSRDPARSPYQWTANAVSGFSSNSSTWLPVNPNYWKLNLDSQKKQHYSHYAVYKRLTELRKTRTIQRGSYDGHAPSEWVFAFSRYVRNACRRRFRPSASFPSRNFTLSVLQIVAGIGNVPGGHERGLRRRAGRLVRLAGHRERHLAGTHAQRQLGTSRRVSASRTRRRRRRGFLSVFRRLGNP